MGGRKGSVGGRKGSVGGRKGRVGGRKGSVGGMWWGIQIEGWTKLHLLPLLHNTTVGCPTNTTSILVHITKV